jgi:hypothetical protein
MSPGTTGSTSAQPPDITIEEMYTFFFTYNSNGASKIIGPERSSTALHFIQM